MNRKIVVDLFAGAGGASQGIHLAAEKSNTNIQLFAIDNWECAMETHSWNFPQDEAICRDIECVDPLFVVPGRHVDLLWASPPCTHFSVARGGWPMDEKVRCMPFVVCDWIEKLDIDRVIIENVPEFRFWGPLDEHLRPIKDARGNTFRIFIDMIKSFGYDVDWKVLNCADYGAPTTRRRLFIQAVKSRCGLTWPEATHIPIGSYDLFSSGKPTWIPAREIIDWSIKSTPLEQRTRQLAQNTMRRIMQGIDQYWGKQTKGEPFVFTTGQTGSYKRPRLINEPITTIVTKAEHCLVEPLLMEYYGNGVCKSVSDPVGVVTTKDRFAIIEPNSVSIGFRMLQPHELSAAQSFPKEYKFAGTRADVVKQIGNSVPPKMAEALVNNIWNRRT